MTKKLSSLSNKRFFIILLLCFLLSMLAALQAYQASVESNEQARKIALSNRLDDLKNDIKAHFKQYNDGIVALRSAMYTTGVDQFKGTQMQTYFYSIDFKKDYPGALGIGFIKWVKGSALASYLNNENKTPLYPVSIRSLSDYQGDHFIIRYVLPYEPNKQAIGLDIASERNRRMAALKAFSLNTTQLTEPITLVQDNNQTGYGFLILTPVYSAPLGKKEPYGWTYSPLIVSDVLKNLNLSDVSVSIYEILQKTETPFFSTMTKNEASSSNYITGQLDLYGRSWDIHMYPKASFYSKVASNNSIANSVLTFVLFFTFFVLIYLLSTLFYQKRATLREVNQLKAIFKSVSGSIIVVDNKLKITSSNRKEIKIFKKDLIKGKSIFEYIKKIGDVSSLVIFNRIQNEMKAFSSHLMIGTTHHCHININPIINNQSFSGAIIYIEQVELFEIDSNRLDFPIALINKDKKLIQENAAFTKNKDELDINIHTIIRQLNKETQKIHIEKYNIIVSYYKLHYLIFFIPDETKNNSVINNTTTSDQNGEPKQSTSSILPPKDTIITSPKLVSNHIKEVGSQQVSASINDTHSTYLSELSLHGIELPSDEFKEALSRFLNSFDTYLEALHSFRKEMIIALPHLDDLGPMASKSLHSIKGGLSTFGFSSLAEQAKNLELMIKDTPDNVSSEAKEKVVLFTSQCQQLNYALHQFFDRTPTKIEAHKETTHPQDEEADIIEELILLLQLVEHCNLRSLDVYKNIRPNLLLLDSPETPQLDDAMDKMDFERAEKLINLIIESAP